MKKIAYSLAILICCCFNNIAMGQKAETEGMKGVVLTVPDLSTVDWPSVAHECGLNTIGTHITPSQVAEFIQTEKGQQFLADCKKYNIDVEHQLHAIKDLLPRELFLTDSTMFRVDENGHRNNDFNCCVHSKRALDTICKNVIKYVKLLPATNHRYYYWLDDGKPTCNCKKCAKYTPSEQALIIENAMLKAIRKVDPEAKLAHLAYEITLPAPKKVKPAKGIFLEFAPILRRWDTPLSDLKATNTRKYVMTHEENLKHLEENLKVFGVKDAVVLEYWVDVSLFSQWKQPAVDLPWRRDVFESDLHTYDSYGLKNFTSFAVYMDSTYFSKYPAMQYLKEYGEGLNHHFKYETEK